MNSQDTGKVTVETIVQAPLARVWELWSAPEHIVKWNAASDDWHTPRAENDLRTGGSFTSRMEARDGSMGFDFGGIYDVVEPHKRIAYTMEDGRQVDIRFDDLGKATRVTERFDAEAENPVEMQRDGWQAILNNFRSYAESAG